MDSFVKKAMTLAKEAKDKTSDLSTSSSDAFQRAVALSKEAAADRPANPSRDVVQEQGVIQKLQKTIQVCKQLQAKNIELTRERDARQDDASNMMQTISILQNELRKCDPAQKDAQIAQLTEELKAKDVQTATLKDMLKESEAAVKIVEEKNTRAVADFREIEKNLMDDQKCREVQQLCLHLYLRF
uniref:Uncharacterized protein n=1 Tax=Octactis speculum TaxID=3111310 RepID=A0A7S2FPS8_9STRA